MDKAWLGIVAFAIAWFLAQASKTILGALSGDLKKNVHDVPSFFRYFGRSGGMPSGHTASFTAMVIFMGLTYGFNSPYFVISACVWTIIVYDATHVRYAVGKQGEALNRLLEKDHQSILPIVEGHTVVEVVVGAIIGILTAILLYFGLFA